MDPSIDPPAGTAAQAAQVQAMEQPARAAWVGVPPQDGCLPPIHRAVRQESRGGFVYGEVQLPHAWQHGGLPLAAVAQLSGDAAVLLSGDIALADFDPSRALFFDLETTGLPGRWDDRSHQYRAAHGRRNATGSVLAFLVGTVRIGPDGGVTLRQYLLRQQPDEPAVLDAIQAALAEVDFLVSFNGKSFDRNILADRFARNRMDSSRVLALPHLDLLHPSRRLYSQVLSRCSLGTLETHVLGLDRPDGEVSGAEVPMLWDRYLATGKPGILGPVLDHNTLDLLSLVTLGGHLADCVRRPETTLPEPQALAQAARLMLQRGDEQRGERLLRRLLSQRALQQVVESQGGDLQERPDTQPFDPVIYGASWVLAEHLRRQARHDEALPVLLSMCAAAGPFDLRPWRAAAIALERRLGQPGEALALVDRALAQCPIPDSSSEAHQDASAPDHAELMRRKIRLKKRLETLPSAKKATIAPAPTGR